MGQQLTAENMENLKELIDSCLEDAQYAQARRDVKAETWAHAGEGAERAADYLIEKYKQLTTTEEGK